MLTSANALAHEFELTPPLDLGDWFSRFFHTPEDELEPFVNVAFIYQNGDGNLASHKQSGTGNWAGTYQLESANTATIQQSGPALLRAIRRKSYFIDFFMT